MVILKTRPSVLKNLEIKKMRNLFRADTIYAFMQHAKKNS